MWHPRGDGLNLDLIPVDVEDIEMLEREILATTERVNDGPMRAPGNHLELARRALADRPETTKSVFKYRVRAGFVGRPSPYNHILFELDPGTDESLITRYLSALVVAWEPDELAAASRETQRAQGRKPQQAVVGWLTYLRSAHLQLDESALDDLISVLARDGGRFVTVPGTPTAPSLAHVGQVRTALGYV